MSADFLNQITARRKAVQRRCVDVVLIRKRFVDQKIGILSDGMVDGNGVCILVIFGLLEKRGIDVFLENLGGGVQVGFKVEDLMMLVN
ncbi:MAG: hypothetical protein EGQ82_06825 [Clostridiales bacterium]|nr:hypothetical protein [Clostridiales bacterium]